MEETILKSGTGSNGLLGPLNQVGKANQKPLCQKQLEFLLKVKVGTHLGKEMLAVDQFLSRQTTGQRLSTGHGSVLLRCQREIEGANDRVKVRLVEEGNGRPSKAVVFIPSCFNKSVNGLFQLICQLPKAEWLAGSSCMLVSVCPDSSVPRCC